MLRMRGPTMSPFRSAYADPTDVASWPSER